MPNIGWQELLVVFVLALIVFGPHRLPEIGRQIGRAIRELRRVSNEFQDEIRTTLALDEEPGFPYLKGPPPADGSARKPDPWAEWKGPSTGASQAPPSRDPWAEWVQPKPDDHS